ncbi:MAG: ABC transporter ATP-binding protein [Spirochaetales bacterium]|nr:ABC transporter ATP-binding protein [Spirochaetales bacterium]
MTPKTPIIELKNLTKYYGSYPGIMDINLGINEGEIFGFLGPNGAGKSTTIRLIIGLIKPTQGEISIFGKVKRAHHLEIFKEIGYLPGDIGLYKDLNGNDYLNHLLKLRMGKNYRKNNDTLMNLQKRFSIRFDKKINTYSKGMRQITGIIQAFMHNPRLLILDEPTTGLDPMMQEEFFNLILEEKKNGKTIFLSSHILSEIEKVCDRVGIIKKGKLIHVEEMTSYRTMPGKNIKIEPLESPEKTLKIINNFVEPGKVAVRNGRIEFYYKGEIQKLIEQLSQVKIKDFICETPRIEDVFFRYYKDK